MSSVCILDYGSGNVKSVLNLFQAIAGDVVISNDVEQIRRATHVVLPGVGAFGAAMRKIGSRLPVAELEEAVRRQGKPFLGICVGMQVLASRGLEFEEFRGLDWIPGTVDKVRSASLPLPHVGWNNAHVLRQSPLLAGLSEDPDFYFVHSYAFRPRHEQCVLATSDYGEQFCSIVQQDNLFGVQFHPEKSQRTGLRLAKNFLALS
jgi:glutamine amidotransferase